MKYIYFDFDGTIADSILLGIEIANFLAPKYNFNQIDMAKLDYYRTLSAQKLLREFKVSLFKLAIVTPEYKIELNKRIEQLKPYDGMCEVLKKLSEKYNIGILTSNSTENVRKFLYRHKLTDYVFDIRSEFQLFGKHNSLRKIVQQNKIEKNKIIYVGDETRDIEATKKRKITSIAVTWGINSEKALLRFKPNFIAKKPSEIVDFAEKFFE